LHVGLGLGYIERCSVYKLHTNYRRFLLKVAYVQITIWS